MQGSHATHRGGNKNYLHVCSHQSSAVTKVEGVIVFSDMDDVAIIDVWDVSTSDDMIHALGYHLLV